MRVKFSLFFIISFILMLSMVQCDTAIYKLTVIAGTGGSIITPSTSPISIIADQSTDIIASADSTYAFVNWTTNDNGVIFEDANSISTKVKLTTNDATVTANFTLDTPDDIIYVDVNYTNGDNTGSKLKPYTNIKTGITEAEANGFDAVYVAIGIYDVTEPITIVEGISIYGGFNNNSGVWTRYPYQTAENRSTYLTQIKYTGTGNGESENPARAIEAVNPSITTATIIEGFMIIGKSSGSHISAIYCNNADPSITYNTIDSGNGTILYSIYNRLSSPSITNNHIIAGSGNLTYGIFNIESSSPIISKNHIIGGNGTSYAINNENGSSPMIYNNVINGGIGGDVSVGIRNHSLSEASMINNTICGGIATENSWGIINSAAVTKIINNIIFTPSNAPNRYGIGWTDYWGNATPNSLQNNDIFDCPSSLYYDMFEYTGLANIGEVNNLSGVANIGNNISANPSFADQTGGDWHLTSSSPITVTQGGLNQSGNGINDDIDGNVRIAPYSIGAYEYD